MHELGRLTDLEIVDGSIAERAVAIADGIWGGIQAHAVVADPRDASKSILAYEVDGYGGRALMDDANAPSLLSLPLLCPRTMPQMLHLYKNTRNFVLSEETNPTFFAGKAAAGVGSPHTGPNAIWPLALITEAMTAEDDDAAMLARLDVIKQSAAGTRMMVSLESVRAPTHHVRYTLEQEREC